LEAPLALLGDALAGDDSHGHVHALGDVLHGVVVGDERRVELERRREQAQVRVGQLREVAGLLGGAADASDGTLAGDVDVHPGALLGVEPEGGLAGEFRLNGGDRGGLVVAVVAVDERGRIEDFHYVRTTM